MLEHLHLENWRLALLLLQEKIRVYRESVASSQGVGDDALSKVLGLERCGCVRGLGSGVTPSKVGAVSENKAHVTQPREEVQQGVSNVDLSTSIPDVSALLDPTRNINVSKVQRVETNKHILEPEKTSNPSQSSSPPQGRRHANMLGRKYKLMNWSGVKELVAIGWWDTNDPDIMVHSTRLGENAFRVWIDDVINGCAPLSRITSFMKTMQDAKGTTIAWPNNFIIFDNEK